ncbi:hypothetical protein ACHAWF_004651 [Thalassiosira exigua]
MTRLCASDGIAKINNSNIAAIKRLFAESIGAADEPSPNPQEYHLPGNVCRTIKKARKGVDAGPYADTLDGFIGLVRLGISEINDGVRRLFDLIYCARLPAEVVHFMSDSYLFCLFKDPDDPSKMRPIAIPCALRRLLASHVTAEEREAFAMNLLPYQFAFIWGPEYAPRLSGEEEQVPTRAAVFVDGLDECADEGPPAEVPSPCPPGLDALPQARPHPLPLGERQVAANRDGGGV